jgi:nucleotide-binding universal stress UspA family protein
MFQTLIAPIDGSEHATKALDLACNLARQSGGKVVVLSVYRHHSPIETTHSLVKGGEEVEAPDKTLSRLARETVDQGVARATANGVTEVEGVVKRGPPARTIVQLAKERDADAIVMGSRGLGDVEGFLLGSVSHKVCSLSECTCITVK